MNAAERIIYDELTPPADAKIRLAKDMELMHRRSRQQDAAYSFLVTGEGDKGAKPPYGDVWDRDYNAIPYPEARPKELIFYEGTGIGCIYGAEFCDRFIWEFAGWNFVRKGSEARKRRK